MPHEKEYSECQYLSPSCDSADFYLYLGIIVLLICCAGLFSGLTMGLLSIDKLNMSIMQMEGSPSQKRYASKILPIINQHHLLLVTLLLANACANETLPIFLNKLVPEYASILISVTAVLFMGEIVPAAVFTGPHQLPIAAFFSYPLRFMMFLAFPIGYPVSKLLDCLLGKDHDMTRYKRKELKALVALQAENIVVKKGLVAAHEILGDTIPNYSDHGTSLHLDEITIIQGALDLSAKTVKDAMIPMSKVFMLSECTCLDENIMADILASGHSRIPIYRNHRSNIIGILLVKRLIVLDPDDKRCIRDLPLRLPIVVSPFYSCYGILNEFQKGRSHMALVTHQAVEVEKHWKAREDIPDNTVKFDGIITIEDILEELIQEEIEDERDMGVQDISQFWTHQVRIKKLREGGVRTAIRKFKQLGERRRQRMLDHEGIIIPKDTDALLGDKF